jgi:hypothetical protein
VGAYGGVDGGYGYIWNGHFWCCIAWRMYAGHCFLSDCIAFSISVVSTWGIDIGRTLDVID